MHRLREINISNWVASIIVVLILVAFFWPQPNTESIREIAERANTVPAESFYIESRIDEPEQTISKDQSFGRLDDIDRAAEYREQDALEKQLRALTDDAQQHINKGEYTLPKDDNAVEAYRQMLALDTNNSAALEGIEFINRRFLAAGYSALETDNEALANTSLQKLAVIDNQSEEYLELATALKSWKTNKKVALLLSKAVASIKLNKLILPARENALYFYQQAALLDPNNEAAIRGVKSVADIYIQRANNAVLEGEYKAAAGYLATVSVIDPQHPSIDLIREMIANAEPIANQIRSDEQALLTEQPDPLDTDNNQTANPAVNRPNNVSDNRTPQRQASEQAAFDRQYLTRGLTAYYKGEYDSAIALLQPLADKGVSRAQFRIAYMYYLGRGYKRDREEADRIIRAALPAIKKFAEEGRSWAQSDLGSLYEDGLVLPRDYNEAVYWYRTAAEKGYPGAQTNLGIMYARGRGVAQSRRTAIEWFQRAAKQGDIAAKRNLESLGIKL